MLGKILDSDLTGKGVVGQPDVPGLSAHEMQYKIEEIVRAVVIPAFNRAVEDLAGTGGAGHIGIAELPGILAANVQEALAAVLNASNGKVGSETIKQIRIDESGRIEYSFDGINFVPAQASATGQAALAVVSIPIGGSIDPSQRYANSLYLQLLEEV